MPAADEYRVRRPGAGDRAGLAGLATAVWGPDHADHLAHRWWWRDGTPHCWIAEHVPSGTVAAVCAQRRSHVRIGASVLPAATVSDWYVAPDHARAGVGRQLVRRGEDEGRFLYTSAISDSAATGFARLGWTGDRRFPMFVGPVPVVRALTAAGRRTGGGPVTTVDRRPVAPEAPGDLDDMDRIWSGLDWPDPVMMVRDADQLRAHLALAGDRGYQLFVARRSGRPVGYLLARILPRGALRAFGAARIGIVSDYLVGHDDGGALRALVGAAARFWWEERVVAATVLAAADPHRSLLTRWGFARPVSVAGRLVGARLSSRSMHAPRAGAEGRWHLTYADNDTDLILGAAP